MSGDAGDILTISAIILDQGIVKWQPVCFHGSFKTGYLFLTAVGKSIIEVNNIRDSGPDQIRGGIIKGGIIVRTDAIYIGGIQHTVEEHHRNLLSCFLNIQIVLWLLTDICGAYQNDAVNFFADQQIDAFLAVLQFIAAAGKDAVITVGAQSAFQIIDCFGYIQI